MLGPLYRGITHGVETLRFRPHSAPRGPFDLLIHGASAGEVRGAEHWLESLRSCRPDLRILRTTGTETGISAGADARLPRDLPRAVSTLFDQTEPKALILTEGELWPNLLQEAARRSIPVGVLGARISAKSERLWSVAGRSGRSVLRLVTAWAAASSDDQAALLRLGVDPSRVAHTGWIKWPPPAPSLGTHKGPDKGDRTLVLGNVHPGEVKMLSECLRNGPLGPTEAHWALVLRHGKAEAAVRREATAVLPPRSWSIETEFGTLNRAYGSAHSVFVGGGGKGRGVHDLLAPLSHGHPPLCFLRRGDPGAVGRTLAARGLVLPLDDIRSQMECSHSEEPRNRLAQIALSPPLISWSELQAEFDGRPAATAWFTLKGVLK
jgi:3-deoxy-D-manno-octulosonic-acid transferase